MERSRILVLVHGLDGQPVKARVELRTARSRATQLKFDEHLSRFVSRPLRPGSYELRIKGPSGTQAEKREVELGQSDASIHVMVAPKGLPSVMTAEGRWYFETKKGARLLDVAGAEAKEVAPTILKRNGFASTPVSLGSSAKDHALLEVRLGAGDEDKQAEKLQKIADRDLAKRGLEARVSVPGYVGKEVAFGITDEIVVRFTSGATSSQIAALAKRYRLERLRQIAWMGNGFLFRAPGLPSLKMLDLVEALNESSLVSYAEINLANRLQSFAYTPGDYLYPETPHLTLINADDAWDTLQTSTSVNRGGSPDVVIGVLDLDGVDPTHADLTGTLSDGSAKQLANFDFVNMANQTLANCPGDHGTQSAGSATGRFDNSVGNAGVAPNCKLIGGRFFGSATDLFIADIWVWMAGFPTGSTAAGFPAQLAQGADIISNSWGPSNKPPNQTLRDAFDFLTTYPRDGRGVVMCFSAGNYGYSLMDTRNPFAADEKTINVGATINTNPTNPCNSVQPDQNGNTNNLPAVVDTRSYINPYGTTMDIVSPTHTCYDLTTTGIVDPIMAPALTGNGDWPGSAASSTTLSAAANPGDTTLTVASTAGFAVGGVVLLRTPGDGAAEVASIVSVGAGTLNVSAIGGTHPIGTSVATRPADYAKNAAVGFGGTSHSCPTVAGAAALMLSKRLDDQPRGYRVNTLDVCAHGPVHRLAVAHVGDIDDHLDQMLHVPARLLDQLADVLHHLVGLLHRVMAFDILRIVEILWTLTAHPQRRAAARGHCLAEVIVEVLLGIGIAGVELADAGVCHVRAPFRTSACHHYQRSSGTILAEPV